MRKFPDRLIVCAVVSLLALSGCTPSPSEAVEQPQDTATNISPTEAPTDTPVAEPSPTASDRATYEVYFNASWSADTHPENYDPTAHFSPFIAYNYDGSLEGKIFQPGGFASAGMEQMAETGATDLLEGEIGDLITAGYVVDFIKGQRFDAPGVNSGLLGFSQAASHIMFVSMIAPSPDWFVSADVNLFSDGQWVDDLEVPLVSYDSGTDSGTVLTAEDIDTDPPQPISSLGIGLQNMGTLVLNRIDQ